MKKLTIGIVMLFIFLAGFSTMTFGNEPNLLVIFKNDVIPDGYEEMVVKAEGQVISTNPDIGTILVKPKNFSTKGKLTENPFIQDIGQEGIAYLDDQGIRIKPNAAQLSSEESYYEMFQWDIKKVGGNQTTWDIEKGNHTVVIGIVDTGVDSTHPDIRDNYMFGKSFVPGRNNAGEDLQGHGTFVAGMIAGDGRVKGVGPGLGVASYRVFGDQQTTSLSIVSKAIVTAANDGIKILNLSLGSYINTNDPETKAQVEELRRAVKYAQKKGVIMVSAAGNSSLNLDGAGNLKNVPSELEGVIAVSATNNRDTLAWYSNYGSSIVDCSAPGGDFGPLYVPGTDSNVDIYFACFGIVPGNKYAFTVGTSMAAPKVSAILGLLASHYPETSSQQLNSMLLKSANDIGKVKFFGHGLVDAWQGLNS